MSSDNNHTDRREDDQRVFFNAVKSGKIAPPIFFKFSKSGKKALIAQYTDYRKISPYSTSIFAQALPPVLSNDDFIRYANFFPDPFDESVKSLNYDEKHVRIQSISKLFRVTNKSLEVFRSISTAIRDSYTDKVHDGEIQNSRGGLTVYGISSQGKTFSTNFSLSYFPQIIIHLDPPSQADSTTKTKLSESKENITPSNPSQETAKDSPISCEWNDGSSAYRCGNAANPDSEYVIQVTWLKVICPSTGGPISLCNNILAAVDSLLGTHYADRFKRSLGYRTELDVKVYINRVKQMIKDIHLGILVIDEIQFLAHSELKQQLADFLVELSDEIGIPICLIGTLEVIAAFNKLSFSFKSKLTKYGDTYFEPFQPENQKAPPEYKALIRFLFKRYQIGKHPVSIEEFDAQEKAVSSANKNSKVSSITDTFYHETGGITQYTIYLFIFLQQHINLLEGQAERAANKSNSKSPKPIKTTQALISKTAKQSFQINREYIDAIISGNKKELQKKKDIDFRKFRLDEVSKKFEPDVDINKAQEQYEKNIEIPSKLKSTLMSFDAPEDIADKAIKAVMDTYNSETESESEFELIAKAIELCKKLTKKPNKPVQLSPDIDRADIDLSKLKDELTAIRAFCDEQKENKSPEAVPSILHKHGLGFNLETELDL
ncbi:ATP-binding protein [Endozoicomonas lisbonensis]|uniref:ORC1/DEAH AAA+ ATPase domain-containing protein n=1 Tax=Endozoicomonas lisbonensis TaxID=3120522 RepID=A0ABV2SE86_9GAMM